MRKIFVMIALILVLLQVVNAKDKSIEKLDMDKMKFLLIPAQKHCVNVIVSSERACIYFSDEFEVSKSDVNSEDTRSFFLNRDMRVESALLNGKALPLYRIENIKAEYFQPRLRLQSLIEIAKMSNVYSISIPDLTDVPDTLRFKLEYSIPLCDSMVYALSEDGGLDLRGENFWYPRNIYTDEAVELRVSSPKDYIIEVNDIELDHQIQNLRRAHYLRFKDKKDSPASLRILQK